MFRRLFLLLGAIAVNVSVIVGCATTNQAPPTPVPTGTPTIIAAPPTPVAPAVQPVSKAQEDWNIFPDPVTGRIEVYKNGQYVGSITGDETEDPPMPHKVTGSKTKPE